VKDSDKPQTIQLSKLLEKVTGIAYPKDRVYPNFALKALNGHINLEQNSFSLQAQSSFSWSPFGGRQIKAQASLEIEGEGEKKSSRKIQLRVQAKESYELLNGTSLDHLDFIYRYSDGCWSIDNIIKIRLLGSILTLKGTMLLGDQKKLKFATRLPDGQGIEGLKISSFELNTAKFDLELDLEKEILTGQITALSYLMGHKARVSGNLLTGQESTCNLTISGEGSVSLNAFQKELFTGEDLPLGIDLNIDKPSIDLVYSSNSSHDSSYSVNLTTGISSKLSDSQFLSKVDCKTLSFSYSQNINASHEASLDLKGSLNINDTLIIDQFDLRFDYQYNVASKNHLWGSASEFKGVKLDTPIAKSTFDLRSTLKADGDSQSLKLETTTENLFDPIQLVDDFRFEFDTLYLELIKKNDQSFEWDLSATSSLHTPVFSYNQGIVSFNKSGTDYKLSVSTEDLSLRFPGDLKDLPYFVLSEPTLELSHDSHNKKWFCGGKTDFYAEQWPEILKGLLPTNTEQQTKAFFKIDSEHAEIGLQDIELKIPDSIEGIDMGTPPIQMDPLMADFIFDLKGNELSATLGLGLPKQVNRLFDSLDWDEHKGEFVRKPGLKVFKVYDPSANDRGMTKLKLSLRDKGLSFKLCNIPFNLDNILVKEADNGLEIISEHLGEFAFDWPELAISAEGVKGTVEMHANNLKVPTSATRQLLLQLGFTDLARNLPKSIPLTGINFAPLENGERKFRIQAFEKLVLPNGNPLDKPDWFASAIDILNREVGKLPDRFLEYGQIEIPEHLYLKIDYNITQSLNFKFSTSPSDEAQKGKPLKLLIPDPTFPQLYGFQLKSISFGELFSGTLFRMDVDLLYDTFDLKDLAASLIIDPKSNFSKDYLPRPKDFVNRVVLEEVVFLIIYQTTIPIPIPVFFNRLSYDLKNALGMEIGIGVSFPMPKLGLTQLKDLALIGSQIMRLFSGKPLELEKLDNIDPIFEFKILSCYTRTPKYISREPEANKNGVKEGSLIGNPEGLKIYRKDGVEMNSIRLITTLIKAIQEKSFNTLLTDFSLGNRIGGIDLHLFDLLKTRSDYALLTPSEFVNESFNKTAAQQLQTHRQLDLSFQERTQYLEVLPSDEVNSIPNIDATTEGLIFLSRGQIHAPDGLNFTAALVLALSEKGLGIALRYDGRLAPLDKSMENYLLDAHFDGVFRLEEKKLLARGKGHIDILGINALAGSYELDNEGFNLKAKTGAQESDLPIHIAGDLKGTFTSEKFHLEGNTQFNILGFESSGELLMFFQDNRQEFRLSGDFQLGDMSQLQNSLAYLVENDEYLAQWTLSGSLVSNLFTARVFGRLTNEKGLKFDGLTEIKLGEHRLLYAKAKSNGQRLNFDGYLSLFPEEAADYISVKGNVDAYLSPGEFSITGTVDTRIAGIPFSKSRLSISHEALSISGSLFGQQLSLGLDQSQNLSVYMRPLEIGPLVLTRRKASAEDKIEAQHRGPLLLVSPEMAQIQATAFFLGVEKDVDIKLKDKQYELTFETTIGGFRTNELTLKGSNFSSDSGWTVSGKILPEKLVSLVEQNLLEIADEVQKKLREAQKHLEVAKEKVSKATRAIEDNIQAQKKALEAEYRKATRALESAKHYLEHTINSEINSCKENITSIKNQIGKGKPGWPWDWPDWFKKQAELLIQLGYWEARKKTLEGPQVGAELAVKVAQKTVNDLMKVGSITLNTVSESLKTMKSIADEMLNVTSLALAELEKSIGDFKELAKLISNAKKDFFKVKSISFDTSLKSLKPDSTIINLENAKFGLLLKADVEIFKNSRTFCLKSDLINKESLAMSIAKAIEHNARCSEDLAKDSKSKSMNGEEAACTLLKTYENLQAIELSTSLMRGGYSLKEIGCGLKYFIDYQGSRPFEQQIDHRRQAILKALRVVQEEKRTLNELKASN